jgi:hypothetical protein
MVLHFYNLLACFYVRVFIKTQDAFNLCGKWRRYNFDGKGIGVDFVRVSGGNCEAVWKGLRKDDFS